MKRERNGFTQVPNSFLDSPMSAPLKVLLALIKSFDFSDSGCDPSQKRLAEACGCSIKSIARQTRELERRGYLTMRPGRGATRTWYSVDWAPSGMDTGVRTDPTPLSGQSGHQRPVGADTGVSRRRPINTKDDNKKTDVCVNQEDEDTDGRPTTRSPDRLVADLVVRGITEAAARRICAMRSDHDIQAWLRSDRPKQKDDPAAYLAAVLLEGILPPAALKRDDTQRIRDSRSQPKRSPTQDEQDLYLTPEIDAAVEPIWAAMCEPDQRGYTEDVTRDLWFMLGREPTKDEWRARLRRRLLSQE